MSGRTSLSASIDLAGYLEVFDPLVVYASERATETGVAQPRAD
ncbi:MAG: hypothetical protein ACOCY6_06040 [Halodesulfurarchaeum sp.]